MARQYAQIEYLDNVASSLGTSRRRPDWRGSPNPQFIVPLQMHVELDHLGVRIEQQMRMLASQRNTLFTPSEMWGHELRYYPTSLELLSSVDTIVRVARSVGVPYSPNLVSLIYQLLTADTSTSIDNVRQSVSTLSQDDVVLAMTTTTTLDPNNLRMHNATVSFVDSAVAVEEVSLAEVAVAAAVSEAATDEYSAVDECCSQYNTHEYCSQYNTQYQCETGTSSDDLDDLDGGGSGRLRMDRWCVFVDHRSGWSYAMSALSRGLRDRTPGSGVVVVDFMENEFSWKGGQAVAMTHPWVGFLHNPPDMPQWFDSVHGPASLLRRAVTRQSLVHCRGIFVMSQYLADWLRVQPEIRADLPISVVYHPTETPAAENMWTWERYCQNTDKWVIQVGCWLRILKAIALLQAPPEFRKMWLYGTDHALDHLRAELAHCPLTGRDSRTSIEALFRETVNVVGHLPNADYDLLLRDNVVFLQMYDSSCNNTVVECIRRHTPILVNRLPAVVEYLGEGYPLYFDTLEEAAHKLSQPSLIKCAHDYLKLNTCLSERLTGERFVRDIKKSEVYQQLGEPEVAIMEVLKEPEVAIIQVSKEPEVALIQVLNEPEVAVIQVLKEPEVSVVSVSKEPKHPKGPKGQKGSK